MMNWSEEKEPNEEVSYNHVKLETPIGELLINWKGWKEMPSYDVSLGGAWLGSAFDLESAKSVAENYILEAANQLNGFIKEQTS